MNKTTKTILAAGLALAVATPALAEFKVSGYYRLMAQSGELRANSAIAETGNDQILGVVNGKDEEGDSRQFIDQRLRMMVTNQLNDNVAIVWHGEVDTVWGETVGKAAAGPSFYGSELGSGGKVGSDGVNVETKNVYLDLKSGDTTTRLGIQTLFDSFEGTVFFDDMAGAAVTHKIGGTTLTAAYSKWSEDSNRSDYDDLDFWVADVKHKFTDNFTLGAAVYFYDDQDSTAGEYTYAYNGATADATDTTTDSQTKQVFFYGLNANAKVTDQFGLTGFVLMQDGEVDNETTADYDTSALAASVKATYKLEAGDLGFRAIYISEADDDTDDERWITPQGRYDFINENQMQFLTDKFVCNSGKQRYAMADAAEAGYGLMAFVLSGNHKLPDSMYVNWGAGYYLAADDERNVRGVVTEREGDTLGYELALRFGKKYFEKVDVSLNLSWADYGDFYDNTTVKDGVANAGDPDGTYQSYLMVNVPF